ncbi:MAG: ERAP1-like C-terminal domain-containing protein, partial [Cryobacterium sp.]|nr:ERAP1-like C-terminal domain-containing protein [Cryobacterium sp.]
DSTRDAETNPSDYVNLVLGNIATETESTTIRTSLTQLLQVARQYVNPSLRKSTIEKVGDALLVLAKNATAGSDAQFQFVKFFANIASTDAHVNTLKALRDGSLTLSGLTIDTDLDWELLEGLVLNSAAGETEIEAALAKDKTATGQQAAARARATVPTSEAKLAAFASLVDSDEQPNLIVRNTALGYQHVNDPVSLEVAVPKYFASLKDIWTSRSYHIAETLIVGLYPAPLASQSLVDATRAWLDANPDTPALRRLVLENLAGVERAIKVQAV